MSAVSLPRMMWWTMSGRCSLRLCWAGTRKRAVTRLPYDGGTLLDLNRHELIYQFDFSVISELTEDDTRQQDDLNSLDELRTLAIDVDYLDPGNGPDGDIEHHTEITLPS